ncbi:MAG: hypothetical protein QW470_00525 [Candidatus Caldarchaeum sp.]
MKKLAAGYFLSAFNALCLTPLVLILIYPTIVTYPASIVLRGLGWRSLKQLIGKTAVAYIGIWVFGGLTYLLALTSLVLSVSEMLPVAAFFWTVYSMLEAMLYVVSARRLAVTMFYGSLVSLVGVALFDLIVFTGLVREVQRNQALELVYFGAGALVASALNSAVASLRIKRREVVSASRYHTILPLSRYTSPPSQAFERTAVGPQPLLTVEVLRRGRGIVCASCRSVNPFNAYACTTCGMEFVKAVAGLKCPVCGAPFSLAKKIEARRYLCGQCASTLLVKGR